MATDYLDPNGDNAVGFARTGEATNWECVSKDPNRYPVAPGLATYVSDNTLAWDDYDMEDAPSDLVECTSIKLWVYYNDQLGAIYGDIYIGGSLQGASMLTVIAGYGWDSITYNGSWTKAQTNGLLARVVHGGGPGPVYAYQVYCEITYTAGATSGRAWGTIFG